MTILWLSIHVNLVLRLVLYFTNKFFNSTFTHSNFSLPPVESLPTPAQQLHTVSIEVSDVFECLSSLDVTKAPGCDNINLRLLKHCATSLVTSITNLLQESICLCTLPEEWKVHKIRPIHKKEILLMSVTIVQSLFFAFSPNY